MWLFIAIVLEVAATVCMKLSNGFSKFVPTAAMFVLYAMSFVPMTWALRRLEVSIAYAVWSAVGTALITIIGSMLFKELMTPMKMSAIALIVVGVVVLNLADSVQKRRDEMAAAERDSALVATSAAVVTPPVAPNGRNQESH